MGIFDEELKKLKETILRMGALVENAVKDSVYSLIERDGDLARSVIEQDHQINRLDIQIDEDCTRLIALRQPKATDLRFITTCMKITTDLERMGDLAVNIAQRAIELKEVQPLKPYIDIPMMRDIAQIMTKDALDAFIAKDSKLARDVIVRDSKIDDLKHEVLRELLMLMTANPAGICWCMKVSFVATYLERIADHATNIAEMVLFLTEGKIIRHFDPPKEPRESCA